MLGHHQPASETPFKFKWRFPGEPMMASIQCYIDPNRLKIMDPNQIEKMILINLLRKKFPLTKFAGSAHGTLYK